jgi:hypothetical protein
VNSQQQQLDAALGDVTTYDSSLDTPCNPKDNIFSTAPSSSGTANIFVYTGAQTALTETKKSLGLIQEVLDMCDGLRERVRSIQSTSIEGENVTIVAVERLVQLVSQNATMQRTLLQAIETSLEATSVTQSSSTGESENIGN